MYQVEEKSANYKEGKKKPAGNTKCSYKNIKMWHAKMECNSLPNKLKNKAHWCLWFPLRCLLFIFTQQWKKHKTRFNGWGSLHSHVWKKPVLNFYFVLFEAVKHLTWWLMYWFDLFTLHVVSQFFTSGKDKYVDCVSERDVLPTLI